jgi:hypothetical protein
MSERTEYSERVDHDPIEAERALAKAWAQVDSRNAVAIDARSVESYRPYARELLMRLQSIGFTVRKLRGAA